MNKTMPSAVEAEEALLGAILIDPPCISSVTPIVAASDFYIDKNKWVFQALVDLHQRHEPIDLVTLSKTLEARGILDEIGGTTYLAQLVESVPTALHAKAYAGLIREAAIRRQLVRFAGEAAQMAYDEDRPLADILDQIESASLKIRGQIPFQERLRPLDVILEEVYGNLERAYQSGVPIGISTGFQGVDEIIGGLRPGNLCIVAARTGKGKTALLLSLAVNAARAGIPVVFFSLEMSRDEIGERLLTMETGIEMVRLQMGSVHEGEWPLLIEHLGSLSELKLWVDDTPRITTAELRAKARRLYSEHGLGLLILDYIQLARPVEKCENRYQEIGAVTRDLKELARELQIPVVAAAQLSRDVERRADKRPSLIDLRESGDQEQDSDIVIFIHRDSSSGDGDIEAAELIVAKHRCGRQGVVHVNWQPRRARFVSTQKSQD